MSYPSLNFALAKHRHAAEQVQSFVAKEIDPRAHRSTETTCSRDMWAQFGAWDAGITGAEDSGGADGYWPTCGP